MIDDDDHPLLPHVGKRLYIARKRRGISRAQAGEYIGLTDQQVGRQERGEAKLNIVQLFRLARLYEVPFTWFFHHFENPPSENERIRAILNRAPGDWSPATGDEKEQAIQSIWESMPDEEHRDWLLNLLEVLVYSRPAESKKAKDET